MAKNETRGTPEKEGGTPRRRRDHRAEFLVALAESGVVAEALKASGWNRATAYRHRQQDDDFAARWDEAINIAVEVAEAELYRRSTVGVDEPVFFQGAKIADVRKYSDNLLMFRLKALRPEKYRDAAATTSITISDERNAADPDAARAALAAASTVQPSFPPRLAEPFVMSPAAMKLGTRNHDVR